MGLLLNEVGNMDDLLSEESKRKLEDTLEEAFETVGAPGHGGPRFFWSEGETMAAFRAGATVEPLQPLTMMRKVDPWRVVERFLLTGATEHGPCTMLIYNNHQLKSSKRPFNITQQIEFCKAVLKDAFFYVSDHQQCIGYGFGGDANCSHNV